MLKLIFSKRFLLHLALALVVVVGAVGGAYYYLKIFTEQDSIVTVPSLEGYDAIEAEAVLKELSLEGIVIDSLYLADKRGGEIVDQEPIADSKVKKDRKIYLTIARYSTPMVKLPNIEDQGLALALAKLESYGFKVGELIPKPGGCSDCALGVQIKGKSIKPSTPLFKGQKVDLLVGEGATGEEVHIPMLYGLDAEEARQLANRDGLNIGATVYTDCEDAADSAMARIFRQSPEPDPNDRIQKGASINVYLTKDLTQLPEVNLDSIKAQVQ